MKFGYLILTSYWTVLVAELIGDKSIYTVASMSVRFRALLVFLGMTVAFAGKSLAAVLLGQALVYIPAHWTTLLSATIFFAAAGFIWFRQSAASSPKASVDPSRCRAVVIPFASLFLTEWCDPGQMSAAALTAQTKMPLAIWVGATLALMTKGTFAIVLGLNLQNRIPDRALRTMAATSCLVLGVLTLRDVLPF